MSSTRWYEDGRYIGTLSRTDPRPSWPENLLSGTDAVGPRSPGSILTYSHPSERNNSYFQDYDILWESSGRIDADQVGSWAYSVYPSAHVHKDFPYMTSIELNGTSGHINASTTSPNFYYNVYPMVYQHKKDKSVVLDWMVDVPEDSSLYLPTRQADVGFLLPKQSQKPSETLHGHDIPTEDIMVTLVSPTEVKVKLTIHNFGFSASNPVSIDVYVIQVPTPDSYKVIDGPIKARFASMEPSYQAFSPPIPARSEVTVEFVFDIGLYVPGSSLTVYVQLDPEDELPDYDRMNNIGVASVVDLAL